MNATNSNGKGETMGRSDFNSKQANAVTHMAQAIRLEVKNDSEWKRLNACCRDAEESDDVDAYENMLFAMAGRREVVVENAIERLPVSVREAVRVRVNTLTAQACGLI